MGLNKLAKKMIKKVVSPVLLKNIVGLSGAVTTYYSEYVTGKGKLKTLRKVGIEVTFRCNCRCRMCPLYGEHTEGGKELTEQGKDKKELTLDEFAALFNDLKDLGTETVLFTGGEAFLRKDMLDITKLACEAGLDVNFTSNAGLITKEIAKKVVELGVDGITISLDGPKEVHEDIRKAKIFDKIMSAIDWIEEEKRLQNKSKPSLDFLCTVSALNQNHLYELVKIAKNKNLPLTIDPIIFTSADDWEDTKKEVDGEFIKKESFIMSDDIGKVEPDVLEKEIQKVHALAKKLDHPVYVSIAGERTRQKFFGDPVYSITNKCFKPWYSCRIDPYGNVYPCSLSISFGNLRENSMKDIINGDKAVGFRNKLKSQGLFPFCKKCCVLYSHNKFWKYLPKISL